MKSDICTRALLSVLLVMFAFANAQAETVNNSFTGTELLKNGQCDGTFDNWEKTDAGSGWAIKTYDDGTYAWASSYYECTLTQTVVLSDAGISNDDIDAGKVTCQGAADMISGWEKDGKGANVCKASVYMLDADGKTLSIVTVLFDLKYYQEWTTFRSDIFTLKSGVRKLKYEVKGQDVIFWGGQFGPHFRNLSLKAHVENQGGSATDLKAAYNAALSAIEDGKNYRVFTMYNNEKYYVTGEGKLSKNVADAPAFSFLKVGSSATEYGFGFQMNNNGTYFTNPKEDNEAALTLGQLNTTNVNSRYDWESQVFFLYNGKYAIRATNAKSGTTGWNWVGSAYWTVNDGPKAEYGWNPNFCWELEIVSGDVEPYTGRATIDKYHYNLDGKTKTAEVTFKESGANSYTGDVVIPEKVCFGGTDYTVTAVGKSAFNNSVLTSVTLPATVTSIGDYAFQRCQHLTSFTLPKNVTSIGVNPFYICTSLNSLSVESGNTKYDSRNGCNAIIHTETDTLLVACNTTVIPADVKALGYLSFGGVTGITSLVIPNSVEKIGIYAFLYCSNLTSVTLPENLKTIDARAFYSCSSMTDLTLPDGLETIGENAFYYCNSFTTVSIPKSVKAIGKQAFIYCENLTKIFSSLTDPFEIDEECFYETTYTNATLYVPAGTKAKYQSTNYWNKFANIEEESNEVKYPIWVGDTQITDKNQDDVLGDGNVSFVFGKNVGQLTIRQQVSINGDKNEAKIWAEDMDLIIEAPSGLVIDGLDRGIVLEGTKGGMLIINGNVNMEFNSSCIVAAIVEIYGTKHQLKSQAICISANDITIEGDLTASSDNSYALRATNNIKMLSGTWTLDGGNVSAISANGDIILPNEYSILEPAGGRFLRYSSDELVIVDPSGNEARHVVLGKPVPLVPHTVTIQGGKSYAQSPNFEKPSSSVSEFKAGEEVYVLPLEDADGRYVKEWKSSVDGITMTTDRNLPGAVTFTMPDEDVTLTPVYVAHKYPEMMDLRDGKSVVITEEKLPALMGLAVYHYNYGRVIIGDLTIDLDGDGTADVGFKELPHDELEMTALSGTNLSGYFTDRGKNVSPTYFRILFSDPVVTFDEDMPETEVFNTLATWQGYKVLANMKRTLKPGVWNTFASPVGFSDFEAVFGAGAKVKQLKGTTLSGGELVMSFEEATAIEGYAPYLVKVANEVDLSQKQVAGVVVGESVERETADVKFIPTMGLPHSITTYTPEALVLLDDECKPYYPGQAAYDMKGMRAYFVLKNPEAVNSIRIDIDDEQTGIDNVNVNVNDNGNVNGNDSSLFTLHSSLPSWYTLDGRKLSQKPTAKGIYILRSAGGKDKGKKTVIE